jgi:malate/lactate dehydrogenase
MSQSAIHKKKIEEIINMTRTAGADVIKLKGSTTYAPGVAIAILVEAVLRGRNRVTSHLQARERRPALVLQQEHS